MSFPTSDDSAVSELANRVLAEFRSPRSIRSASQLYRALGPPSLGVLLGALEKLLKSKKLKETYRVHSPFGDRPGIDDFSSVLEIPSRLFDEDQEAYFDVGPEDIEVLFKKAG